MGVGSLERVCAAPKLEGFKVVTVFDGFTGVTVTTLDGTATVCNEKEHILRYVLLGQVSQWHLISLTRLYRWT